MYSKITCAELVEQKNSGVRNQLIDVRSPNEFAAGHIPRAMNIPLDQVESRIGDLDGATPVILICQSGMRADIAAKRLSAHFNNLAVLEGGTAEWRKQHLPVVQTQSAHWSLERQVRLIAGLLVTLGVALAILVDRKWIYLAGFVGLGLTFAGATDICLMGKLLAKMPWNKNRACNKPQAEPTSNCSC